MPSASGSRYFLLASLVALLLSSGIFYLRGYAVLPHEAPPARCAEVARSVWKSLSLQPPEFLAFKDELSRLSRERHEAIYQDIFSLGRDGQLFPKHSLISGVIGAPFYGLFGDPGFWILQQILALLLFYSMFRITTLLANRDTGVETLLSLGLFTQTLVGAHCYMFSYDLHGLVMLICGLHLMYSRPSWGSALVMLSLFVRPSYVLIVPFVLGAWWGTPAHTSRRRGIVLGAGSVLCLYLLVNDLVWGGPLVTSYHRVAAFGPSGELLIEQHPEGFNMSVFVSAWRQKLFGTRVGLVLFNPALIAFPWVCVWAWRWAHRRFALITLIGSVLYGTYFFSYERWDESFLGNRFLLPSVCLYLLSFIPWLSGFLELVRERRSTRKLVAPFAQHGSEGHGPRTTTSDR